MPATRLTFAEYREGLTAAGFTDIEITSTHEVADAMHSAIIRAVKPAEAASNSVSTVSIVAAGSCCGVSACCTPAEQALDQTKTAAEARTDAGRGCQS